MQEFQDKVAVVTGAASGIGRAIAERCVQEGMKVVLADIEEPALAQTEAGMRASQANVLAVVTDIAKSADVKVLAQRTLDAYGAVHLLCNNAGVGAGSTVWESTINDWKWVLRVNLWGVIHCVREFAPVMLEQGTEGHIVNTASVAGLMSYHGSAAYQVSKHAVVALSEKLYYDLAMRGARIHVSVLCPDWVKTRIMDSERNRPPESQNDPSEVIVTPEVEAVREEYRRACEAGMSPAKVADYVFEAIRSEKFYILTHPEFAPYLAARANAILEDRNPANLLELMASSEA